MHNSNVVNAKQPGCPIFILVVGAILIVESLLGMASVITYAPMAAADVHYDDVWIMKMFFAVSLIIFAGLLVCALYLFKGNMWAYALLLLLEGANLSMGAMQGRGAGMALLVFLLLLASYSSFKKYSDSKKTPASPIIEQQAA